ncbi:hypothetical protein N7492_000964 [Penicillium capsulatum]|uniref:Uncharacterized protein n=1 Tax=Penicillium capsulatum TaxID=69766 RepID=A0A9W9ISB5_9EURO|nr:hypothetical protein N7492_000964 [Penicillium capsulatum]KAJ6129979.1 hypothetical protein N7512_002759 [Penicillium capsulatum]
MNPIPVAFSSPVLSLFSCLVLLSVPVSATIDPLLERSGNYEKLVPLDKPLLAIQIGSIVGSYVIFVAVLLALLLLVGRKLRRTVQSSNYSLQMEMLKPVKPAVSMDPSPISPISHNLPSPSKSSGFTASWGSLGRGTRPSHASFNGSMVTVDESVVASDRQRAQDEMEMLYAAVMEHDAKKASGVNVSARDSDSQTQSPDSQLTNPFTDRAVSQISEAPPPVPPKSPRPSRLSKLFSSNTRSSPDAGKLRSPRLNIRKQQISSPLASPDATSSQAYPPEQPPLSPRFYTPGPPPSAPRAGPAAPATPVGLPGPASPKIGKIGSPSGRARPPAPLSLATASKPASSLPFRDAYPLQSAPATKTTILERPTKNRNGPITGMPTPYSAYMPFTPVTPFTPGRTVKKHERRRQERENGLRVLNEDDLVKGEDDMWG